MYYALSERSVVNTNLIKLHKPWGMELCSRFTHFLPDSEPFQEIILTLS